MGQRRRARGDAAPPGTLPRSAGCRSGGADRARSRAGWGGARCRGPAGTGGASWPPTRSAGTRPSEKAPAARRAAAGLACSAREPRCHEPGQTTVESRTAHPAGGSRARRGAQPPHGALRKRPPRGDAARDTAREGPGGHARTPCACRTSSPCVPAPDAVPLVGPRPPPRALAGTLRARRRAPRGRGRGRGPDGACPGRGRPRGGRAQRGGPAPATSSRLRAAASRSSAGPAGLPVAIRPVGVRAWRRSATALRGRRASHRTRSRSPLACRRRDRGEPAGRGGRWQGSDGG